MEFKNRKIDADDLIERGLQVSRRNTPTAACVDMRWVTAYGMVMERVDRDRRYGLSRYPYEAGSSLGALTGGFFDHPEWTLRKGLEKHPSMRAAAEYE